MRRLGRPNRAAAGRSSASLRGVLGVRTFVCCAVKVCVLETQKCSLSDLPRDRLNTSLRKDRVS